MKIAKEIIHLNPYVPGLPIDEVRRRFGVKDVYKLASNENALGPSPKALQALTGIVDDLHRYPDGSCYELRQGLSKYYNVPEDWLVFGNGSDDLVTLIIRAFANPEDQILTGQYFFAAYRIAVQACRLKCIEVPAREDYSVPLSSISETWRSGMKIVFIANPNNPTGHHYKSNEIEEFLKNLENREDVLLVFDEAYHDFVRDPDYKSAVEFQKEFSNVIVLRTFSKIFGLAGLRLGVMIAHPEISSIVNRVRLPFNVNTLIQKAALAAVEDVEHVKKSQKLVWSGLDYIYRNLKEMKLPFVESQGNFVFFDTLRDSREVDDQLLKRGVILRPLRSYGLSRHLRFSVGLAAENEAALAALRDVLPKIRCLV